MPARPKPHASEPDPRDEVIAALTTEIKSLRARVKEYVSSGRQIPQVGRGGWIINGGPQLTGAEALANDLSQWESDYTLAGYILPAARRQHLASHY